MFKCLKKDLAMYTEFISSNFIVMSNRIEIKHIFKMVQIIKIFCFIFISNFNRPFFVTAFNNQN